MASGFTSHECTGLELSAAALAERTTAALRAAVSGAPPACRVVRVEIPIPAIAPLAWLGSQPAAVHTFWRDRDGVFEAAGVGEADAAAGSGEIDYDAVLTALNDVLTPAYPHLRYYGGVEFSALKTGGPRWNSLGSYRFVIPRFEALREGDQHFFACTVVARKGASVQDQFDRVVAELSTVAFEPDLSCTPANSVHSVHLVHHEAAPPLIRRDMPDRAGWMSMVREVLFALEGGDIEKLVLARESRFEFADPINPVTLLDRLADATPNSYHFCFQPRTGVAFIGASPERLYKRAGRRLESEALAGTRPRGVTPAEDEALGAELLRSDKDVREHRFVLNALREAFRWLCQATGEEAKVSLLKLQTCQHLFCRMEGLLSGVRSDADILRALHPTPAVGGFPTEKAVRLIAELEPFERGWYTGPVGWVGHDSAEFAVAIRSGLVHGATLALYSGAGIVTGSTPEAEWDEIENKMGSFLGVLKG